jgi:eukaryotic-like serine/threonine-protein kinase
VGRSDPVRSGIRPLLSVNATVLRYTQWDAPWIETHMFAKGQVIGGRFSVLSEIGRGDLGVVYRATEVDTAQEYAIKQLTRIVTSDGDLLSQLEEEITGVAKLHHPHIANEIGAGETEDGEIYTVRPFIEGRTLEEVVRREGPLPVPRACSIGRQIASALEAAHSNGQLHGDLNLSNVLLAEENGQEIVKVLGFGFFPLKQLVYIDLARIALHGQDSLVGSPEYLAPERVVGMEVEALDGRSDLYSLGVILYAMLSGHLPFQMASAMQVLLAQLFDSPPPLSARTDVEIPEALETMVMRTLAKRREDRPAAATVLVDHLHAWEKCDTAAEEAEDNSAGFTSTPAGTSDNMERLELEPGLALEAPSVDDRLPEAVAYTAETAPSPAVPGIGDEISQASVFVGDLEFAPSEVAPEPVMGHSAGPTDEIDAPVDIRPTGESMPEFDLSLSRSAGAPTAGQEAATGAVLFSHGQYRKRRGGRLKGVYAFLLAATLTLMIVAGGWCGWVLYTGRTYWFQPQYVKQRFSKLVSNVALAVSAGGHSRPLSSPAAAPPAAVAPKRTPAPSASSNQVPASQDSTPTQSNGAVPSTAAVATGSTTAPTSPPAKTQTTQPSVSEQAQAIIAEGDRYFQLGHYKLAIQTYEKVLRADPGNTRALDRVLRAKRAMAAEAKFLGQ